jgi:tetratricopeptide (TPR) repeat protein
LTKALTGAGLKTQAALAERIADLEGLEAAPRDIVSRVFREQPVDAATLERVARALGVEAFTLYLGADEVNHERPATRPPASEPDGPMQDVPAEAPAQAAPGPRPGPDKPVWLVPGALIAAALIAAILVAFVVFPSGEQSDTAVPSPQAAALQPKFGRFRVAVTAFKGDESGQLAVAVRERLEKTLGVASAGLPLIAQSDDRAEIAARFRTDIVLDGEIVQVGQWIGVTASAYVESRGRREQIWAESFQTSTLERRLPIAADNITAAVHRLLGMPAGEGRQPPHFPLAPVQTDYLNGRDFLDKAPSELNLRRAQGRFEAALRHDPNYAAAHAGVCEVALDAVWIDERRQLSDAERACARALQLDPNDPSVLRAQAYFLSRSGRAEQALALYRRIVAEAPDDMEAVLGLAGAEFALYQRTGEERWREPALEHARRAAEITSDFWKPYMWLGIYEQAAGSVDRAIVALERAAELDVGNEYVVANLGTMYFCRGDFEKARDLYLRSRDVAPANYAGTEMLGMLYYFLRDFDESARLRQEAIDMARAAGGAEIHQMWGSLADSLRQSGARERAIEAYVRAAEIIERDFMMKNATTGDKASRAYYYTALMQLDGRSAPRAMLESLERDLREALDASTESYALLRLAQTHLVRGDRALARAALDKALSRCPCYASYPDLESLAD